MTDDQVKQARGHAASLQSLIDYQQDGLTELLEPIRQFLLELAGPELFDGPGEYHVRVCFDEGDQYGPCCVGVWVGQAQNRDDARRLALDKFEDHRLHGWYTDIIDNPDQEEL